MRLMKRIISRVKHRTSGFMYRLLDGLYLSFDRREILRTRNIQLIPGEADRRGGKYSYAEWAHVVGIFQTLMNVHAMGAREDKEILDVGCGTGLLAIASEPFVGPAGRYVGLDVSRRDIEFCRRHYQNDRFEFLHFDINNPAYAPDQDSECRRWPLGDSQFDLVAALSVWTHLREEHADFYLREVARVLKPGGRVIITFFLLDDCYERTVHERKSTPGRYYNTPENLWIFDQSAYGSPHVFHPAWARVPEHATGITRTGLDRMLTRAGLNPVQWYPGSWKQLPGVYFQDVLILEKPVQK